MKKSKKKVLVVSLILFLFLSVSIIILFFTGVLQSIFESGYNSIEGLDCNYETGYCDGTVLEGTDYPLREEWRFTNVQEDWNPYKLRKYWISGFFYEIFDLDILKTHAVSDGKGGVNYYTDMFPEHCLNRSHFDEVGQVGASITISHGYPVNTIYDVIIGCTCVGGDNARAFKNIQYVGEIDDPNSQCSNYQYTYEKAKSLENCKYVNGCDAYLCTKAEGVSKCGNYNSAVYETLTYTYNSGGYRDFAVKDLTNSQKTVTAFEKFSQYNNFNLLNPTYHPDEGWHVDPPGLSIGDAWMMDTFDGKVCRVMIEAGGNMTIYGHTKLSGDKMSCLLEEYASLDGKKVDNAQAEILTNHGEMHLTPSMVDLDWEFYKTEFPILPNCLPQEEECLDTRYYKCESGEFVDVGECGDFIPVNYYRYNQENKQCSEVQILNSEKTKYDFKTLEDCERRINWDLIIGIIVAIVLLISIIFAVVIIKRRK